MRKPNRKNKIIVGLEQALEHTKAQPINNIGSTMTLLEQAINALIIRINVQTQRIKDMM